MKTMMLTAALVALALPACAATPDKLSPPTVSKQQVRAYNQTYQTDKAQEKQLKAHGG